MDTIDPKESPEVRQAIEEIPSEALQATTELMESFSRSRSRRWLLGGAVAGAAGIALTGTLAANALAIHAEGVSQDTSLTEFYNILATGEELFATFYAQAIDHHKDLDIHGSELIALEAIRTEEELHRRFAISQGGKPATDRFSFPYGTATFTSRARFLETQQLAENLTNEALLAWIKDMADMRKSRLAQLGGQLLQVEGGHRVIGRLIMGMDPIPNWGFGPVKLNHFTDVPQAVTNAGFLSPHGDNDFTYRSGSLSFTGVIYTTP